MFYSLSKRISNRLVDKGVISNDEDDICSYGLFMIFSHTSLFIVTIIFGFLLKQPLKSILFYIQFQVIRRYAGGYHASSEWKCNALSALSTFVCIWLMTNTDINNAFIIVLTITIVSAILIALFCPVDTKEKPLSDKEFRHFRKITIIVLLVFACIIIILMLFGQKAWTLPTCFSVILESILLIAGKVKNSFSSKKVVQN